jgi:hypothetical protein
MEMPFDWRDVLKRARTIVEGKGDETPCVMGRFCPRCCGAIAKGQLDREHDIPMPPSFSDFTYASDQPMVEARTRIAAHETDTTKLLTREEALALIDAALED